MTLVRRATVAACALAVSTFSASAQLLGPSPAVSQNTGTMIDSSQLDRLLSQGMRKTVILPEDTITVNVLSVKDFDLKERVSNAGFIHLPLIGDVKVSGLTTTEAAQSVTDLLVYSGMILRPQVDVSFVAEPSSVVTISGDVAKPGVFPSSGAMTLGQLIGLGGGLRDDASSVVTLLRPELSAPVSIPLSTATGPSPYLGIPLTSGDHVVVAKIGLYYVVGAVGRQGPLPLKNDSPTTVFQAISAAGGAGYQADMADAAIIRDTSTGKQVIPLDLRHLKRQEAAAIVLQTNDVLFVPTSDMKAAIKSGGTGIIIALSNTASYFSR